jgi:hypothetical protein
MALEKEEGLMAAQRSRSCARGVVQLEEHIGYGREEDLEVHYSSLGSADAMEEVLRGARIRWAF